MKNKKLLIALFSVIGLTLFYTSCSKDEEKVVPPTSSTSNNNGSGIITNSGAGVTFDGYTYTSIVLGNGQEWMAENLRTTKYCNGDIISNITDSTQWHILTTGAWVYYNNDSQYENPYGKLYNWYAVEDSRNVCPCGWHVPSDAEWLTLINYLGGESVAGGKMKSTGSQYWFSPNSSATNESGFLGLPGGGRYYNGMFDFIGENASWWSSTEAGQNNSLYRVIGYYGGTIGGHNLFKEYGQSVRCIKD